MNSKKKYVYLILNVAPSILIGSSQIVENSFGLKDENLNLDFSSSKYLSFRLDIVSGFIKRIIHHL